MAGELIWIDDEIDLIAGADGVVPDIERVAAEEADVIAELIAEIDADFVEGVECGALEAAGVAGGDC